MINSKFNGKIFSVSAVLILVLSIISLGQKKDTMPTMVYNKAEKQMNVAERNNVYCAGFITNSPITTNMSIVGANDENEQNVYAQGDFLYVNQGSSNGVKVGDMMSVVRPSGNVKARSESKGKLGYYVQEVGAVEVVKVMSNLSVARVKTSCDAFYLGDLVQPMEFRAVPLYKVRPALDLFIEPNGKRTGKIVMSRDGREALSKDQIAFVDLGSEDSVSVGEYLTVFRPLGTGGVKNLRDEETVSPTNDEFGSNTYKGTDFSILSPRKSGSTAEGGIVTTGAAKKGRPAGLRKVVGEAVVLRVNEKTATILITRNAQEIHTGDWVEVQ